MWLSPCCSVWNVVNAGDIPFFPCQTSSWEDPGSEQHFGEEVGVLWHLLLIYIGKCFVIPVHHTSCAMTHLCRPEAGNPIHLGCRSPAPALGARIHGDRNIPARAAQPRHSAQSPHCPLPPGSHTCHLCSVEGHNAVSSREDNSRPTSPSVSLGCSLFTSAQDYLEKGSSERGFDQSNH